MSGAPEKRNPAEAGPGSRGEHTGDGAQVHGSTVAAREYLEHGLALVPIAAGRKSPTERGWQRWENAITDPERAGRFHAGIGLLHAWSQTCAIDVDDYQAAEAWLADQGLDLAALLTADGAVQIRSGRPGRAKLLYALPDDCEPLETVKLDAIGLELRCAARNGTSVQDVLPPSVHPDTGRPYEWAGAGDWRELPELPPELLAIWRDQLQPQRTAAAPGEPSSGYGRRALERACATIRGTAAGGRNDALNREAYKIGQFVAGGELGADEARADLDAAARDAGLAPTETATTLDSALAAGAREPRRAPQSGGTTSPPPDAVIVRDGELTARVRQYVQALQAADVPIYDRGGQLVRPVRAASMGPPAGGTRRGPEAVILRAVEAEWLRLRMAEAAQSMKWDGKRKAYRDTDPPAGDARTIAMTPDEGGWPYLRAVVRHPVLTQDGRVIAADGYDPGTALLVRLHGEALPLPEPLDRDAAAAARERLERLLRHYPFISDADRAVALSLLLTALARPVLPTAPLHGVDAPVAGTGKSLLVDVAAILATGERATVMEWGRDPVEAAKRLDALLLAGDPVVAIDNIETALHGAALCQTLTQPVRRVRPLGGSALVTAPCTALMAATGNNLTLRADLVRRSIVCRLDPGTDQPENRAIDQDLLAEAAERRDDLVRDALTVMAAYIRQGAPDMDLAPLGSFTEWSRMVRAALVWSGAADPCEVMDRLRDADPERQAIAAILTAWRDAFGREGATVKEAIQRASIAPEFGGDPALAEALETVALRNGRLDARSLGYWLRAHRDSRAGDLRLVGEQTRTRANLWRVASAEDAEDCRVFSNARGRNVGEKLTDISNREAKTSSAMLGILCTRCDGEGCAYCNRGWAA